MQKLKLRSQDDSSDQVYLKSTWVVTSLRHPALRLLGCAVHLILCFFIGVTSPLLTSLQTPARFPVYGDWIEMATTSLTWQKVVFQTVLSALLLVFLRLVAYPRLVQHQWNWHQSYRHATRTFSRLSQNSESDYHNKPAAVETPRGAMALHTFTSRTGSDRPAVRVDVWNVGSSYGSWTFVAALFPFFWAVSVYLIQTLAHQSTLEEVLFPEDQGVKGGVWDSVRQLDLQTAISTILLTLSCLKFLVTLDWVLQDHEYNRVLFGNWLWSVRRVYNDFSVVRLMWCWICLAGVAIGGVCFGAISKLQTRWMLWNLDKVDESRSMELWLLNTSWHVMLSALVVVLDLLWIVQDSEFPNFASPVGSRMFGLHKDQFSLGFLFQFPQSFSSKWVGGFLVLALLLPLELCHFFQMVVYSPDDYAQEVNSTTFRIFPADATLGVVNMDMLSGLDATNQLLLLKVGSLSRYFSWSAWDRAPSCAVLFLGVITLLWLWRKEQCKMCFAVFLGLSEVKESQATAVAHLNTAVPAPAKRVFNIRRRLRELYQLRARGDSFCIGLSALSALTVCLQFRAIWRSSAKYRREVPLQAPGETYAALLLLITFILLHQVYRRYCIKMEIMALRCEISPCSRNGLWRSPRLLLLPFLTEIVLCGVFLPPLVHGRVYLSEERYSLPRGSLNVAPACPIPLKISSSNRSCELQYSYPLEIVNMVVLVRLYWLGRVVRNQLLKKTIANKGGAISSTLFRVEDVPIDSLWWSFRISFALHPSKVLFTLFTLLWVSTAATVSIFERPFPSKLDGEDHALWLTLVTMTGVGYGDAYPITMSGRIAIVLGAVVGGLAFISLMTSEFLESLKGTKQEHMVLSTMEYMQWERTVRRLGVQLIYAAWKRHLCLQASQSKDPSSSGSSWSCGMHSVDKRLMKAARQFKVHRRQKPMQCVGGLNNTQTAGVSDPNSCSVKSWVPQDETAANLEQLERYMDTMTKSFQALW